MNKKERRLPTKFAPETRFDLAPASAVPFRGTPDTELEQLKQRLLSQLLAESPGAALNAPLRRAANDAATLAWTTPCPLLVFPLLLDELAAVARLQALRQKRIRERSHDLLKESV